LTISRDSPISSNRIVCFTENGSILLTLEQSRSSMVSLKLEGTQDFCLDPPNSPPILPPETLDSRSDSGVTFRRRNAASFEAASHAGMVVSVISPPKKSSRLLAARV
jgi:hypothetical protein